MAVFRWQFSDFRFQMAVPKLREQMPVFSPEASGAGSRLQSEASGADFLKIIV